MIKCTKMNGFGNDFIVIDNMNLRYTTEQLVDLTVKACRPRVGIGADGILVTEPSHSCDFKMRLINRDGSEAEMCGNGARCVTRFAYENGIVGDEMTFETLGGAVKAKVRGKRASVELSPIKTKDVPLSLKNSINGYDFCYTFLTVGVPHAVIFENSKRTDEEYRRLGGYVRHMTELFPEGANVTFAVLHSNCEIGAVTFERGVEDLTLSCGTGCVAAAIVGYLRGFTGTVCDVRNPGGVNRIKILSDLDGEIVAELEGAVARVAEMELSDEIML